jgi:hypothetical protein
MSRWSIDPPDDDAYDVRDDGTACDDCGRPSVAWLCETCSDQREAWAAATALRMAETYQPVSTRLTGVVDVALVPIQTGVNPAIVEVALVPTGSVRVLSAADARDLKRMARAFLAADLSNVKDVA